MKAQEDEGTHPPPSVAVESLLFLWESLHFLAEMSTFFFFL